MSNGIGDNGNGDRSNNARGTILAYIRGARDGECTEEATSFNQIADERFPYLEYGDGSDLDRLIDIGFQPGALWKPQYQLAEIPPLNPEDEDIDRPLDINHPNFEAGCNQLYALFNVHQGTMTHEQAAHWVNNNGMPRDASEGRVLFNPPQTQKLV